MIVGGAVSFHLDAFLLPGSDDVADISIYIDDIAETRSGELVEVARLILVLFWYVLHMRGMLGVPELVQHFLDVIFIFDLHGTHGVKSMYR
jgi:hypothetical protein